MAGLFSVVDPSWELIDPNPDIHQLFQQFNEAFFDSRLGGVYVQWSPRMTLCAGTCKFHPRNRECSIQLSKPLLSYRARKDLVETLLHEMIHAFLFIADGNRERESHGPKFHEHMYRINKMTGANITVYHTFHDEVSHFKTHWWKCNGPCQHRHPFYGIVKRSMNRAPGPNDFWYKDHQANCGGTFVKIKEPSPKKGVKRKKEADESTLAGVENKNKNKITNYFGRPSPVPESAASKATATPTQGTSTQVTVPPPIPQPAPFTGRGITLGSIGNRTQPSSTSLFGRGNTTASANLSSGNNQPSSSSLFGSGNTTTSTNYQPSSTSLFGSGNTIASTNLSSGNNQPSSSSLFGSGNTTTSTSLSSGNNQSSSSSLFGSGNTTTSTNLSSGNKLGTGTSQQSKRPPGRGEHPLFAKWKQNYKTPISSSAGSSAPPTSSSSASGTTGSQTNRRDFSSCSTSSSAIREPKKRSEPIEVIDLE